MTQEAATEEVTQETAANGERSTDTGEVLLEVRNLKMYFPVTQGIVFQRKIADIKAVDEDDDSYIKWEYDVCDRGKVVFTLDDLYDEDSSGIQLCAVTRNAFILPAASAAVENAR